MDGLFEAALRGRVVRALPNVSGKPNFLGKCKGQSAIFMMKDRHKLNPLRHPYQ